MKLIAALLITTCFALTSHAQRTTSSNWFKEKLKAADSVIMVSHHRTKGHMELDSLGNLYPTQELMLNNRPNYAIILERKLIKGRAIDSLEKILTSAAHRDYDLSGCFSPHHAIFIFKGNKTSYLNLCFNCVREESSKDLYKLPPLDSDSWRELKAFFIQQGFKYQLRRGQ